MSFCSTLFSTILLVGTLVAPTSVFFGAGLSFAILFLGFVRSSFSPRFYSLSLKTDIPTSTQLLSVVGLSSITSLINLYGLAADKSLWKVGFPFFLSSLSFHRAHLTLYLCRPTKVSDGVLPSSPSLPPSPPVTRTSRTSRLPLLTRRTPKRHPSRLYSPRPQISLCTPSSVCSPPPSSHAYAPTYTSSTTPNLPSTPQCPQIAAIDDS